MTEPQPPERKPIAVVPIQPQRPDSPSHLSAEEAEIWRGTVNAMRPDWFIGKPAQALLQAFCLQVVLADDIAAQMRGLRRKRRRSARDEARYDALVAAHVDACKTLLRLASILRLTPLSNRQSIRDARVATPRPWPWERA